VKRPVLDVDRRARRRLGAERLQQVLAGGVQLRPGLAGGRAGGRRGRDGEKQGS
jgi:hypothetical protein